MPKEFWDRYIKKQYDKVLSIEECFKNKAFLTGCCVEYLLEKGQTIHNLEDYRTIEEALKFLQKGVAWTR